LKEYEGGGALAYVGQIINTHKILIGKSDGRKSFGRLRLNGRMLLN
jgi:hypothetical protein